MHTQVLSFVEMAARHHRHNIRRVLEYGSRDINGSVRPLFRYKGVDTYHGIDLLAGNGVDEVADATTFRPKFTPDLILCCEVLEHCHNWRAMIANAWLTLPTGGILILTCATAPRAPHGASGAGGPAINEHYANIKPQELVALFGHPTWTFSQLTRLPQGDLQLITLK